jgi:hypothetical protein
MSRAGGVDVEAEAGVGGEVHGLVRKGELADDGVAEALDARAVELHVVPSPAGGELLAAGAELADQLRQHAVVRRAAGLRAQERDRVVGAPLFQSTQKSCAAGSRNRNRAVLIGPRWAKSGESNTGA